MKKIVYGIFLISVIAIFFNSCDLPNPSGYYIDAQIDGNYKSCVDLSCTYDVGNNQMILQGKTIEGDSWTISFFVPADGSGTVTVSPTDPYTYIQIEVNEELYSAKEDNGSGQIIVLECGEDIGDEVSGEFQGTLVSDNGSISVTSGDFSVAIDRVTNFKKK